ncbi:hypothetical protein [Pseudomonas fluorescens]|nr:hypothetical protein [Pseudomonas fluorescens]
MHGNTLLEEKRAAVYWITRETAEQHKSVVGVSLLAIAVSL